MKFGKRTQRKLFRLVLVLVVAGLGYFATHTNPPAQVLGTVAPGYYRVTEISDGDTIVVDMDGRSEHIRMIGVDTPETKDPRKSVQCFGQAASDFTKQALGTQTVRLEADPLSTNRDRYDRLLRYVYLENGQLLQAEIIKQGYGFAYTSFPFTKSDEFKRYQTEARTQNKGLWSNCQPTANQYGGFTSNNQ